MTGLDTVAVDTGEFLTDSIDFRAALELSAEILAQAGIQIDFRLNGGEVDAAIDYEIKTNSAYNQATDTLTVLPTIQNMTTGGDIAFETAGPNLQLSAEVLYDLEGIIDIFVDFFAEIGDLELADLSPNSNGVNPVLNPKVEGAFALIDYDSRDAGFTVPVAGVDNLLPDVLEISFGSSFIETEGTAALPDLGFYEEGGLISFDPSELVSNFKNATFGFSPEFLALLNDKGIDIESGDSIDAFAAAFGEALEVLFETIIGEGDTDGDGVVPVFLLDATDDSAGSLALLNLINPDTSILDTDNLGQWGFYVSSGESEDVFNVTFDIDQLIAIAVNRALGNPTEAVVNPFDLEFGINEVLEIAKVPEDTRKKVTDWIDITLSGEILDFDAGIGLNYKQEFALSIDNLIVQIEMESGERFDVDLSSGDGITVPEASAFDANGDGQVDYSVVIKPDATLFNDSEIGIGINYALDFLKASFTAGIDIPLEEFFPDNAFFADFFSSIEVPLIELGLGPILRFQGDIDALDIDFFEDIFELAFEEASVPISQETFETLV